MLWAEPIEGPPILRKRVLNQGGLPVKEWSGAYFRCRDDARPHNVVPPPSFRPPFRPIRHGRGNGRQSTGIRRNHARIGSRIGGAAGRGVYDSPYSADGHGQRGLRLRLRFFRRRSACERAGAELFRIVLQVPTRQVGKVIFFSFLVENEFHFD